MAVAVIVLDHTSSVPLPHAAVTGAGRRGVIGAIVVVTAARVRTCGRVRRRARVGAGIRVRAELE